ncbi:uncharacterized protein LOC117815687 isoform X2 [Xyrichtys novacula]|uniref:Uncharacterized protein LOC117815687 isoform X2 n=1 Tax=Xyrichtys novacula TaxID=13765 RepID=A0AAV1EYP7_XYRNO|nr:uncharacterized protein LOC117815687 isoform X2 [Xyrichtys novacula]
MIVQTVAQTGCAPVSAPPWSSCVLIMKMVLGCDPENGCYGFHQFGNNEELLPVLDPPRKRKKRVVYYEVGNLNAETYLGSENLPNYVTQNFGFEGEDNTDRLIISYKVRSRVVDKVYVTQHDRAFSGRFSPNDTYEISSELIQALQSPYMEVTSFLTQMGYYGDIPVVGSCDNEYTNYQSEQISTFNNYSCSTVQIEHSNASGHYSVAVCGNVTVNNREITFNEPAYYSGVQYNYRRPKASKTPRAVVKWCDNENTNYQSEQIVSTFNNYSCSTVRIEHRDASGHYSVSVCGGGNVTVNNRKITFNKPAYYSGVQHNYRRPKASKTPRAVWPSYSMSELEGLYRRYDKEDKGGSRGSDIIKILLGAGALLLAVKCFSWLGSCLEVDENISKSISRISRTPRIPLSFRNTHVMLDYVF